VRWHRADHYGDPSRDLRECIRELVFERAGVVHARPDSAC